MNKRHPKWNRWNVIRWNDHSISYRISTSRWKLQLSCLLVGDFISMRLKRFNGIAKLKKKTWICLFIISIVWLHSVQWCVVQLAQFRLIDIKARQYDGNRSLNRRAVSLDGIKNINLPKDIVWRSMQMERNCNHSCMAGHRSMERRLKRQQHELHAQCWLELLELVHIEPTMVMFAITLAVMERPMPNQS